MLYNNNKNRVGGIIMEEMWLARDKSEILFLYVSNYEPIKEDECWACHGGDCIALNVIYFLKYNGQMKNLQKLN